MHGAIDRTRYDGHNGELRSNEGALAWGFIPFFRDFPGENEVVADDVGVDVGVDVVVDVDGDGDVDGDDPL